MCIASEGNYFHVAHIVFPFLGDFLSSSELTTILFFCLLACLCTYQSFNSGVCRLPTPSLKVFTCIRRTTDFIILNGPTRVSGPSALVSCAWLPPHPSPLSPSLGRPSRLSSMVSHHRLHLQSPSASLLVCNFGLADYV